MDKRKKIGVMLISMVLAVGIIGNLFAFQILSVDRVMNAFETQDIQYSDDNVTFASFSSGANVLPNATIGVGSSVPLYLRNINNANRDTMITYDFANADPLVEYQFQCASSGSQYSVVSGGSFGQGLSVEVKGLASTTTDNIVNTILSFDAPANQTVTPQINVARTEIDPAVVWTTCP